MKFERLGDITKNLDSRRIPLNSEQRIAKSKQGLYPYIGANNIVGYIDEYIFDEKILCVAEDGGTWGTNQTCAVMYEGKTWVNNHAHVLVENGKANLDFLRCYLNLTNLNKYIKGATRGKLNKGVLENILIPLPSLSDQIQIANILSKAETLIEQRKQSIALLDEFLKSTFLEMFGDPASNKNKWKTLTLKELSLRFSDGPFGSNLKTEHYSDNGVQVIRLQNIGINEFVEKDISYVKESHYEAVLKKYSCYPGDIVIATMGAPNIRACIVPKHIKVAVNKADCVLFRVNNKLTNSFLISHFSFDES